MMKGHRVTSAILANIAQTTLEDTGDIETWGISQSEITAVAAKGSQT